MSGPSTNPYSTQTQSGYNSSPPADDGTAVVANQLFWSTIKTKITDPVLTLAQAINAQLLTTGGKIVNTDADVRNSLASGIAFEPSTLTIATGSVTASGRSYHAIDTEASAATDDLDTMVVTNASTDQIVILSSVATARVPTVKHNTGTATGKFLLAGGADCVLGNVQDRLVVQRTANGWVELCRSVAGAAAITAQYFLTQGTQTYTVPSGVKKIKTTVIGGGGGGGGVASSTYAFGGGGGGGGAAIEIVVATSTTVAVTVGAGGVASVASGTATGGTGGTSSFGSYSSATGGAGGRGSATASAAEGTGGVGSSASLNIQGGPGGGHSADIATIQFGGQGGNSIFGGGGNCVNGANGATGGAYGGGGSGGHSTASVQSGGAGADGAVIVEEYY